jgi:hypothetical protein
MKSKVTTISQAISFFIEECDTGEFKLSDKTFAKTCRSLGIEEDKEDIVMQAMIDHPKDEGEFVRISDGWLYIKNEHPHCGSEYSGKLFFNTDGSLDMAFVSRIAE